MLNEETPVAAHRAMVPGRNGEVDRIKAALVLAAAFATVLVALVAARSFIALSH